MKTLHTHIRWAGVNGTSTIYIPSGSIAEDRLQLRFTSDGTLGASKVVNITPLGGTTIDGNAEEPLTTPYDGMTAQLLNNEWQVIQRKK